jgi:heptosyltransferase III
VSPELIRKLNNRFRKFLIVRTDRIGDVILTLPLVHVIKKYYPDAHITVLIKEYTSALFRNHPQIDNILYYDVDGEKLSVIDLLKSIRKNHFDIVFHAHPRPRLAFITWIAGIPTRVGTGYRWYSLFFNRKIFEHRKDGNHHELEYNLHLLRAIGLEVDDKGYQPFLPIQSLDRERVNKLLEENGIDKNDKLIILHPGSKGSSRDWSPENFGLLGNHLSHLPGVKIVVSGGSGEQNLVNQVKGMVGTNCIALCDKFSLSEFGAFAERASLFISNSTGPIHVAAAVGTFVVGFYPQIPHLSAMRWGPYTSRKKIFTPQDKPLDCDKCFNKKYEECECMNSIEVKDVFESILLILQDINKNKKIGSDNIDK